MNTSALMLMIATQVIVTAFTIYFFWKVLKTPSKPETESPDENDHER